MIAMVSVAAVAVSAGAEPRLLALLGAMLLVSFYKLSPNIRRLVSGRELRF